ncbi:response regulator [Oricola cellulosilytica]|nr:response regulator [Oricola cellulosilytica]
MTRCMIVDGSSVVRKVAKRILTAPLEHVYEAETGVAALAAIRGEGPDLVIVDSQLPDMDVVEFVTKLRATSQIKQPVILVMMTELDLVVMMKAKRAGANDYLLKPFDREQLIQRVQEFGEAA